MQSLKIKIVIPSIKSSNKIIKLLETKLVSLSIYTHAHLYIKP